MPVPGRCPRIGDSWWRPAPMKRAICALFCIPPSAGACTSPGRWPWPIALPLRWASIRRLWPPTTASCCACPPPRTPCQEAICSASIPTSWNPSCANAWGSRPCSPPVSANARPGPCSCRRRPRASGRLYGSSVSRADSFWRRPGARRISPSFWRPCASVCRTCSTCRPCAR